MVSKPRAGGQPCWGPSENGEYYNQNKGHLELAGLQTETANDGPCERQATPVGCRAYREHHIIAKNDDPEEQTGNRVLNMRGGRKAES